MTFTSELEAILDKASKWYSPAIVGQYLIHQLDSPDPKPYLEPDEALAAIKKAIEQRLPDSQDVSGWPQDEVRRGYDTGYNAALDQTRQNLELNDKETK